MITNHKVAKRLRYNNSINNSEGTACSNVSHQYKMQLSSTRCITGARYYVKETPTSVHIFRQIKDPKHPLHNILPPVKVSNSQMTLRPTYPYQVPFCKNTRYGRDFVPYCISKKF